MRNRTWLMLAAGAALLASADANAQARRGSGIRVTKDGNTAAVSTMPSTSTTVVSDGEVAVVTLTPFDLAPYANLSEKNMTAHMAAADSLELEISRLAQSKGSDQRVRDYATMLVNDHSTHLAKTIEVITDEDVGAEPLNFDPELVRMREVLTALQTRAGSSDWDAAFLRFQAAHHQNEIDLLTPVIKNAHDDDLEELIKASLQSLARHRDSARTVATALGFSL